MAAIVFPSPANVNDEHVVGDRKWKFNGTAWKIVPRTTDWAGIEGKPAEFPPAPHLSEKITDFVPAVNEAITELDAGTY